MKISLAYIVLYAYANESRGRPVTLDATKRLDKLIEITNSCSDEMEKIKPVKNKIVRKLDFMNRTARKFVERYEKVTTSNKRYY